MFGLYLFRCITMKRLNIVREKFEDTKAVIKLKCSGRVGISCSTWDTGYCYCKTIRTSSEMEIPLSRK